MKGEKKDVAYNDLVVIYLTHIIFGEILVYTLVDFFVIKYMAAGTVIGILLIVLSINYILFKLRWFFVARINLIFVAFMQVTLTSFVLFSWEAGFYLYYFTLIALTFALFDFGDQQERRIIVIIMILVFSMFGLDQMLGVEFNIKSFSPSILKWFNFSALVVSLSGVAALFWVFAEDVYSKKLALDKLANTDGLTQVMNRRRFFELSSKIYKETKRSNGKMALVIFDIDLFKQINDTYGHPAGDEILKALAQVVKGSIRKSDLFARYGGEEFAVLLNDTNLKNAIKIAEDIRVLIDEHSFKVNKKQEVHVTVSIGIASLSEDYDTFDSLLQAADRALYRAKRDGRNRVVES